MKSSLAFGWLITLPPGVCDDGWMEWNGQTQMEGAVATTGSEQGSKAKVGRCQGSMCVSTRPAFGQHGGAGETSQPASDNESSRLADSAAVRCGAGTGQLALHI